MLPWHKWQFFAKYSFSWTVFTICRRSETMYRFFNEFFSIRLNLRCSIIRLCFQNLRYKGLLGLLLVGWVEGYYFYGKRAIEVAQGRSRRSHATGKPLGAPRNCLSHYTILFYTGITTMPLKDFIRIWSRKHLIRRSTSSTRIS